MFKSDLYHIVQLLIPSELRHPKIAAWIKVLISQVKKLMAIFTAFRTDTLFLISHNSQVAYLEHYLNAIFNPDGNKNDPDYNGNGIYITDATPVKETFLYNGNEHGPATYLYNTAEHGSKTYLYNDQEYAARVGFIINVPTNFNINNSELISRVNRLRLAGKQFKIQNYTI